MTIFEDIAIAVRDANPGRVESNINRRILKLIEEIGEAAQAYLNVTSPSNGKDKTWDDVREEIADVLIVALDIAWTPMTPIGPMKVTVGFSPDQVRVAPPHAINNEFDILCVARSLGRYLRVRDIGDLNDLIEDAVALCQTVMPDQTGISEGAFDQQLLTEIKRKLGKWTDNRSKMAVVTDDV